MTWDQGLFAVDGNTLNAQKFRQMLMAATLAQSGVIQSGDLQVSQLSTPGAGVQVAAGACIINGVEVTEQGSYAGYNNGIDTVSVAATGASTRYDLIIARVEDPTFAGSPWSWLPGSQPLIYSRDISNVVAGTNTVPAGTSGIPLALLTIPPSTSVITNSMITDLRSIISPSGQPVLRASTGVTGFPLQNATPTILSWTTPNDGAMHRAIVRGFTYISVATTGGQISLNYTPPSAAGAQSNVILTGTHGTGYVPNGATGPDTEISVLLAPNTTISVVQSSAMTAGTATFYGELWGI